MGAIHSEVINANVSSPCHAAICTTEGASHERERHLYFDPGAKQFGSESRYFVCLRIDEALAAFSPPGGKK
jgi:hypothetical protein